MPTCGWLMIGVSNSAPRLPVLVSVNVPPDSSSGLDLAGPGPRGQVGDLAGQAAQVEVAGVVDDRHHQAALGVDRDAEVLGVVVGHLRVGRVDHGVDHRVDLERLHRGEREERQEAQLDALAAPRSPAWPAARSRAIAVTSASTTVVSWADVCRDSTIRWAITWRGRDIRWVVPRSADGRSPAGTVPTARPWAAGRAVARAGPGGAAAGGRGAARGRGCRGLLGGLGLAPGAGRVEDVLLADPPADAGAGHGLQVDAVLGGELADQRRHVRAVTAGGQRGGRRELAALILRGSLRRRLLRRGRRERRLRGAGRYDLRLVRRLRRGRGWAGGDQGGAGGARCRRCRPRSRLAGDPLSRCGPGPAGSTVGAASAAPARPAGRPRRGRRTQRARPARRNRRTARPRPPRSPRAARPLPRSRPRRPRCRAGHRRR